MTRWAAVLTLCTVALAAAAGRTSAVQSGCIPRGLIDHIVWPTFKGLLQADAILHVRVAENGRDRPVEFKEGGCEILNEAPATVLGMVSLSGALSSQMTTARALTDEATLNAGSEYIVFHEHGRPAGQLFIEPGYSLPVKDGRVFGPYEERLGIDAAPVDRAMAHLREAYKLHTRYRNYNDLTSAAAFETLRYKTGWIELGVMDSQVRNWAGGQPFAFERGPNGRVRPRPGDRILLNTSHPIYIRDFGSRGEDLRIQSPATGRRTDLADETGTHASAHVPYTVADVRCKRQDDDRCGVWMRLIAK